MSRISSISDNNVNSSSLKTTEVQSNILNNNSDSSETISKLSDNDENIKDSTNNISSLKQKSVRFQKIDKNSSSDECKDEKKVNEGKSISINYSEKNEKVVASLTENKNCKSLKNDDPNSYKEKVDEFKEKVLKKGARAIFSGYKSDLQKMTNSNEFADVFRKKSKSKVLENVNVEDEMTKYLNKKESIYDIEIQSSNEVDNTSDDDSSDEDNDLVDNNKVNKPTLDKHIYVSPIKDKNVFFRFVNTRNIDSIFVSATKGQIEESQQNEWKSQYLEFVKGLSERDLICMCEAHKKGSIDEKYWTHGSILSSLSMNASCEASDGYGNKNMSDRKYGVMVHIEDSNQPSIFSSPKEFCQALKGEKITDERLLNGVFIDPCMDNFGQQEIVFLSFNGFVDVKLSDYYGNNKENELIKQKSQKDFENYCENLKQ